MTTDPPAFLVAPTERPPITDLGPTSSLPERMGVDIIWQTPNGLAGVQRKAVPDLIASVRDSRLGMELTQMRQLHIAMVVIEGQPSWTTDGQLLTQHTSWSLKQQRGVEWSIQSAGVMVCWTRNPAETVSAVQHLYERTQQPERVSSLLARPNPQRNGWGRLSDRDMAVHFLSGIPGIRTELASRIWDHFKGVPLRWECGEEEFLKIKGIGKEKVAALMKVLT